VVFAPQHCRSYSSLVVSRSEQQIPFGNDRKKSKSKSKDKSKDKGKDKSNGKS